MPADNTFGISENVLVLIQHSSGGIMYGINAVLTPLLVVRIVKEFHGKESQASSYHVMRVVNFSRMFLMLVIPAGVTIMANQDCGRGWLGLWNTCQADEKSFAIDIHLTSPGLASQNTKIYLGVDSGNWAFTGSPGSSLDSNIPVTSHNDICAVTQASGRCSRAVVSTLGHLVVSKLFFAAFVSPVLALAIQTQLARDIKRGCKNLLTCKAWSAPREDTIDLSVEIAGLTMMFEYCLVLGFVVPIIIPLTWITFVLHLAVFYRATQHGFELKMDAKPSSGYLRLSLVCGCALIMWFFFENNLHGQMLVGVGMPLMALAAVGLDKAMPLSEAPWAWLVYAPSGSVNFFTDPKRQPNSAAQKKEETVVVELGGSSLPTMGGIAAADSTASDNRVVRV